MLNALIKLLLPAWNFFDDTTFTPIVYFQINQDEWKEFYPPPETRLINFFYNPYGNLYLFYHSLIQRLINDIFEKQNNPDFNLDQLSSFKILHNWIKKDVHGASFRFKLVDKKLLNHSEIIFQTPFYDSN